MEKGMTAPDDLLPTVLDITIHHRVSAGSETREYDTTKRIDYRDIRPGDSISSGSFMFGKIMVKGISDKSITILYDGEIRTMVPGDEWTADHIVVDDSPYDSRDEITMTLSYYIRTAWMQIPELTEKILMIHEKSDSSVIPETIPDEQRVLMLLDLELENGNVGLYPLVALLNACNNWYTAKIVRIGQFRQILLEGIEKGALAPDDEAGWNWMKVAAETNDPETFMSDMDRYYDLISNAVENGNTDALDIMNTIWEPEQIIEED